MTNRPKNIGTAAETAVVRVLRANGFPQAERRALRGHYDEGDITGTPGIVWEVKGGNAARTASDGLIEQWLVQTMTERANAAADYGVLVVQRPGVGAVNADRWWAYLRLHALTSLTANKHLTPTRAPVRLLLRDLLPILRAAGYGDPIEQATA